MKTNRFHPKEKSEEGDEYEHALYEAFSAIKSKEEARRFLQDLCTPTEIQAMADRWRAVDLIKKEKPYRKIYEETGVSVTTIGRVARCILMGEGGYNLIYKRTEKKSHERAAEIKNSNTKKGAIKK